MKLKATGTHSPNPLMMTHSSHISNPSTTRNHEGSDERRPLSLHAGRGLALVGGVVRVAARLSPSLPLLAAPPLPPPPLRHPRLRLEAPILGAASPVDPDPKRQAAGKGDRGGGAGDRTRDRTGASLLSLPLLANKGSPSARYSICRRLLSPPFSSPSLPPRPSFHACLNLFPPASPSLPAKKGSFSPANLPPLPHSPQVEAFEPSPSTPKLVILDLCSGFGYLGMLLSELLPPHKVERIVLVDVRWAPHNTTPQPHHLSAEHILDPGWPIRLSTSRSDLKSPSDRRILARSFLSHGSPAMLLGVHLCGTLSLHAVEIFNDCPCLASLCLKPCCLPPKLFARRGDVFGGASGHLFPAAAVSVDGKWNRGKWVGRSAREEVESKFHCWVDNLSKCIRAVDDTSSVSVESHVVQTGWFQNLFIFSERQWRADPPYSARHSQASGAGIGGEAEAGLLGEVGEAGKAGEVRLNVLPPPNTSNSCGLSEARKEAIIGAWREEKKEARRQRRAARWSAEQRERARRIADAREGDALCVTIDFSESCEDRVQFRCLILPQKH